MVRPLNNKVKEKEKRIVINRYRLYYIYKMNEKENMVQRREYATSYYYYRYMKYYLPFKSNSSKT